MQGEATGSRSDGSISTTLLQRVRAHDAEAWQRLVHIYGPVVFRWCQRAGLRADDAADVGQEVFRSVATSIEKFKREKAADTFVGWLRTITRYKIADFQRLACNRPSVVGGSTFLDIVSTVSDNRVFDGGDSDSQRAETNEGLTFEENHASKKSELSLVYHRALEIIRNEFRPKTWQAFWNTAVLDRATADVAADLKMSNVAVRKAKSRVLRRLRDEFIDQMET